MRQHQPMLPRAHHRWQLLSVVILWIVLSVTQTTATNDATKLSEMHQERHLMAQNDKQTTNNAVIYSNKEPRVERQLQDTLNTAIDKSKVQAATFHNAYGTQFVCTRVCYFISATFIVMIVGGLTILFLIPVVPPSQGESVPFLLWFGDRVMRTAAEIKNHVIKPNKTYESIGVATDDSLLPSPRRRGRRSPRSRARQGHDSVVTIDDPNHLFDAIPSKRGIFAPSTASRRQETSFFSDLGSRGPSQPPSPSGRKRAAQRHSMTQRAEARAEQVKSDIDYKNLREDELQMYDYLEFIRELLEGLVLKKVCQRSSRIVKRTFYVTPELSVIYWNKLGRKQWIKKKSSLDPSLIDKVLKGVNATRNLESKGKQEHSALYVSVITSDGKQLDLEAKDEAMRHRLFLGFTRLAAEKKEERRRRERGELPPPQPEPVLEESEHTVRPVKLEPLGRSPERKPQEKEEKQEKEEQKEEKEEKEAVAAEGGGGNEE